MKKRKVIVWSLCLLLFLLPGSVLGQTRISDDGSASDPDASALLELKTSLGKGLLLPRVNNTASVSSPKAGMVVFSIVDDCVMYYNGSKWISLCECSEAPATPGTITLSATTVNLNGTFTASVAEVSGATSYTWTLPSGLTGSSSTNSIIITGSTGGSYAASGITVKAVNGCGTSAAKAATGTITVKNCSSAPGTPGSISFDKTTVNLNGTFTASVSTVSGATSYEWTLPSGLSGSSSTNSITITASNSGSIALSGIKVTASNACGTSSSRAGSGSLTVNDCSSAPAIPGTITLSSTTVNLNGTFTASVAAVSGAKSYIWTLPGGLTGSSTTNTIIITATMAGSISASLITVKANNGCGSSAASAGTGTITVLNCMGAPSAPGTIVFSSTTVKQNEAFTASVAAVSGATSYTWTLPDGLSGSSTSNVITLRASNIGSIAASSITVKANNDCGSSAATAGVGTITVSFSLPTPTATLADNKRMSLSSNHPCQHSMVIKNDGTVILSGQRYVHPEGGGYGTGTFAYVSNLTVATNGVAVASGPNYPLILKADGTLATYDMFTSSQTNDYAHLKGKIENITNAVRIAVSSKCGYALRSNGTIWGWGIGGTNGLLGNSPTTKTPVYIEGFENIVEISASEYTLLGLKNDGTVWAVGSYTGDGTTAIRTTPVKVMDLTNVVEIASVGNKSYALTADGTLWFWGSGQSSPRQITTGIKSLGVDIAIKSADNSIHYLYNNGLMDLGMNGLSGVGYYNSLILRADGAVWFKGDLRCLGNSSGQTTSSYSNVSIYKLW